MCAMSTHSFDIIIIGGGMVGLCIAHQLLERDITKSIAILDKEPELGRHSSGVTLGFYTLVCTTSPAVSKQKFVSTVQSACVLGLQTMD